MKTFLIEIQFNTQCLFVCLFVCIFFNNRKKNDKKKRSDGFLIEAFEICRRLGGMDDVNEREKAKEERRDRI
jgi:hypothetical protein